MVPTAGYGGGLSPGVPPPQPGYVYVRVPLDQPLPESAMQLLAAQHTPYVPPPLPVIRGAPIYVHPGTHPFSTVHNL
jgi:hypothetical protein